MPNFFTRLSAAGRRLIAARLFLTKIEKVILAISIAVGLVGLAWWGKNFYYANTALAPHYGGVYAEGVVGSPRLVNPVLADTGEADGVLEALIFSGLFRIDGKSGIEYDLAEETQIAQEGREYLISLKPDLLWHDGERLTVEDVLFTIDLIKNPALRNPYALNWQGVTAEKLSDRTIKITLPVPYQQFLQNLTFRVLPKHLWKDIPTQNFSLSELNVKPIGSGPYRFKRAERDKSQNIISYTLAAQKRFHHQGPYLESITLKFYQNYDEAIVALKKKEIDGLAGIPQKQYETLAGSGAFQTLSPILPRYFAVFWNNEVQPFQDIKMREALARAVNRERMLQEVLGGRGKIIDGPIMEGLLGGGGNPASLTYDPASSTRLLEELGWKDVNEEGIREKRPPGRRGREAAATQLEFELFFPDTPALQTTASLLVADWKAIGVRVTPKPSALAELLTTLEARSYRAVLFGQVLSQDPDPFAFWHSSQKQAPGLNLALWSDKKADSLLEKIRGVEGAEERKLMLEEFQSLVAKDYAALFLWAPDYLYAVGNAFYLPELRIISAPHERFHKVNEWYLHTKRVWQ